MSSFFLHFTTLLKEQLSKYSSPIVVQQKTKSKGTWGYFSNTFSAVTNAMSDSDTLTPKKKELATELSDYITRLTDDNNNLTVYKNLLQQIITTKYHNMWAISALKSGYSQESRLWLQKKLTFLQENNFFDLSTEIGSLDEGGFGKTINALGHGVKTVLETCMELDILDKQYDANDPTHAMLYHLGQYQIQAQMKLSFSIGESRDVLIKKQMAVTESLARMHRDLTTPDIANEEDPDQKKAKIIIALFRNLHDLANANLVETSKKPALNLPLVNISTLNIMSIPIDFNHGTGLLGKAIGAIQHDLDGLRKAIPKKESSSSNEQDNDLDEDKSKSLTT